VGSVEDEAVGCQSGWQSPVPSRHRCWWRPFYGSPV
jgi:hypothetical protein